MKIFAGVKFEDSQYTYSECGRRGSTLIQDALGYTYSLHGTSKLGREQWHCSRKRAVRCKAAVTIQNGYVFARNEHNHASPLKL